MLTMNSKPLDPTAPYRRVLEAEPQLLAAAESTGESKSAPELAPEAGAALVRDIEQFLSRYVIFPPQTLLPLALWSLATFTFESFDAFPYLVISSPTKQCGKTRTLEILELVVSSPRRASNPSEAALFRIIEKFRPTLMLDEAETLNSKGERAEYLRAILNAGNRSNATVPRCVRQGVNQDVQDFSIYCPKIVAGIGRFPETLTDRAICLSMQRRKSSEEVSRFLFRTAAPEGEALRERARRFVKERAEEVNAAYESADLIFLPDRDAEVWQPLFALLAISDSKRVGELKSCAVSLTQSKALHAEDDSLTLRLLSDLRAIWPANERHALTAELLSRLKGIEDAPWAAEMELNPRKLARLLRGFRICPTTVRADGKNGKGYCREDAEAAFSRYLSPETSQPSQ
jgi:hypothetical protein